MILLGALGNDHKETLAREVPCAPRHAVGGVPCPRGPTLPQRLLTLLRFPLARAPRPDTRPAKPDGDLRWIGGAAGAESHILAHSVREHT